MRKTVDIFVYQSSFGVFEVFITEKGKHVFNCQHVCIGVTDISGFIGSYQQIGLEHHIVAKGEKHYVFVCDMVGNVFEIKEMK